jgi:hypothetical protein
MMIVGCTLQQAKQHQEVTALLPSQAAIGNEPTVKTKIQAVIQFVRLVSWYNFGYTSANENSDFPS